MLDVSSRKRNGLLLANTIAGIRDIRHEAIRFTYRQIQHRDMLFRYANRHDFIVRRSDCTPRVILPSPSPPPPHRSRRLPFLLFVHQTEPSCCNDDGVGGGGSSGSRKSQINPFVIPHRSFQPVRISTTSLLCHLRTLPKLFPFSLPSLYRPVKRDSTIPLSLSVSSPLSPSDITLFSPFLFLLSFPLDSRCIFASSLHLLGLFLLFSFISCLHIPFA